MLKCLDILTNSYENLSPLLLAFLKESSMLTALGKREPTKNRIKAKQSQLVVDLCCGLGGISLAASQLGMEILAGLDLSQDAIRTFSNNFPNAQPYVGSVRSKTLINECFKHVRQNKSRSRKLVVVSGPPCQGFSVAGPRDPSDPRNQVLVAVARAIVKLNPKCGLIENVARVLDPCHSRRLKKFRGILNDGGFHIQEIVLNAADFGVPQRRRRAFFFLTKRRVSERKLVEILERLHVPHLFVGDALADLPSPVVRPDRYSDEDESLSLPNHFAMQHSAKVKKKIAAIPQGKGPMSYRRLHPERISNTLISGHRAPPAHYLEPRSITVREAARLQGFPDDFRIYGSFGKQMTQVTNAVPPPMARAALLALCEAAGVTIRG